jgi:hypothetical protein
MPPFSPRPDQRRHGPRSRTAASASCLLVTILAANQAAARDAPASLPYLQLSAPVALRFAAAPVLRPPPPPLGRAQGPAPASEPTPGTEPLLHPDEAPANPPPDAPSGTVPTLPPTPVVDESVPPAQPPPEPPPVTRGLPLLPDDFARPAPLGVEEFLPFFAPPPRPVSRATYEIK